MQRQQFLAPGSRPTTFLAVEQAEHDRPPRPVAHSKEPPRCPTERVTRMDVCPSLGRRLALGAMAGAAGAGLMGISQRLGRCVGLGAEAPLFADATCAVLGLHVAGEASRRRLDTLLCWGYGIAWGTWRGALASHLSSSAATGVHFASGWGKKLLCTWALGIAPPPQRWGVAQLAGDAVNHLVYATGAGAAYDLLESEWRRRWTRSRLTAAASSPDADAAATPPATIRRSKRQ